MGLISKIFGDFNSKQIARIEKIADTIESYDAAMQQLSDEELKAKTQYFKEQLAAGKTLDDILPEAFAVCREAGSRVLGMKHFRVQLMGGVVLHEGNISEMKTGEGKTLVATLPAYLNALEGKGVHVVTVNDYLAQRDKEWMGQIYEFLGLTVGCIVHGITSEERKAAYEADITYGTNNEFGFDYLRDNMAVYKEEQMQRPLNYAIVDEVDSILIDEARTPLIISGMGSDATDLYKTADRFVKGLHGRIISQEEKEKTPFNIDNSIDVEELNKGFDYTVDEKERSVSLTAEGITKAEKFFGIENFADPENMEINHHVQIALKAHYIMKADVDYIEKDGEIIIVDEFTGRLMFGRRFSDGLHQAIEAKEGITVRKESKTLATITIQNYFRMYKKLAGMTGTAKTEEDEFREIYNMQTVVVPPNKPVIRDDMEDAVYSTTKAKLAAIVEEIVQRHATGQPVLVGTISVEKSEILSMMLKKRGVKHDVLNAKQHMREAEIIAQAGRLNAVTIATNMAGRGTDIILGGGDPEEREKVVALGGLHVLGTERHESRRIDNQLRGRSGRQGDPGSSQFFVSLEDDLMRLFGGDKVKFIFDRTNMADERIEAGLLSKTIEGAQKKIESRNYASRKYVLQYDDVMNKQREIIYGERNRVLHGEDLGEHICSMMKDLANEQAEFVSALTKDAREWDFTDLKAKLRSFSPRIQCPSYSEDELAHLTKEKLAEDITAAFTAAYKQKKESIGPVFSEIERMILLRIVDSKWMDHIDLMDQLKKGMGLRAYGQQDPAVAYANEGLEMFEDMIKSICEEMVKYCFAVTLQTTADRKQRVSGGTDIKQEAESLLNSKRGNSAPKAAPKATSDNGGEKAMPVHVEKTPGRNDPCPCGSGKKYKNCCGKQTE